MSRRHCSRRRLTWFATLFLPLSFQPPWGQELSLGAKSCLYPGSKFHSTTKKLGRGAATCRQRVSWSLREFV